MIRIKPCYVVAVLCILLSGCASMNLSQRGSGDELRQASAEWDRRYNAGDAAGLAALYAVDAVSMPPGAATLTGRSALQADFQSFFAANTARHETTIDQVVYDGDLAIERARYRLTFQPKAGGAQVIETGRHIECRKKIGGTWQIVAEIWNTDPAPAR